MIQRSHYQALRKRLDEPRRFIQVIVGPRQVGKTTLARQLLDQSKVATYDISADDAPGNASDWLHQQWELARIKQRQAGAVPLIFCIDEVQKIPNWSETVKANWDADTRQNTPIVLLLLGSSRLLLQQGLTESLMGRFELTYLPHWSLSEMSAAFGFSAEQYVWFGGYPGAAALLEEDEQRWKAYVKNALIEPSISRDILSLTRVDKPALLRRLFEAGCQYSSQMVSFNKILGQLQDAGNTTTLAHYLNLLDSAGLLGGLEKYAGSLLRQKQSSPKFQVHNTALISAQSQLNFQEIVQKPDQWGRVVESAIGAHLLNLAREGALELYYWREGNYEVDFVLKIKNKILGIEVKSGIQGKTSGMDRFRTQADKILLVGQSGLPWQEFLAMHPGDLV
jgi:predicted AAA+ superfamily ATPase